MEEVDFCQLVLLEATIDGGVPVIALPSSRQYQ